MQVAWGHPIHGVYLASCSYDRTVRVWSPNQSNVWELHHICRMNLSVNSIAWSPPAHGCMLAAASSDGSFSTLRLFENDWSNANTPDAHKIGVNSVSWKYVNAKINPSSKFELVTGGSDNMVFLSPICLGFYDACLFIYFLFRYEYGSLKSLEFGCLLMSSNFTLIGFETSRGLHSLDFHMI